MGLPSHLWMGNFRVLAPPPPALARPSCPRPVLPPEHISLIRLPNDLMHILAASIKLNQVTMRLSFFEVVFFLTNFPGERSSSQKTGEGVCGGGVQAPGGRGAVGC